METEEYKGVTITIRPGNIETNATGTFTLSWPGHEPEAVKSQFKQTQFILAEAQEFVDQWLEDEYIKLPEPKSKNLT